MAEGKVNINLSIAGRDYSMNVDVEKEELYREAARRLDKKIALFTKVPKFDAFDRLAMAALRYSMTSIASEQASSLGDADLEELHELCRRIEDYVKE